MHKTHGAFSWMSGKPKKENVMSQDRFTEVTSQSWLSRIGGAIKGVLMGFVLFILAFPLLFWNEGRAVTTYKTLKTLIFLAL